MEKNTEKLMKTKVFNVIILDKSGSMERIRQAAIDGFNETLAGIKKAQEKYAETQEHFVSLLTFCSCERNYVYDKTPATEASPLQLDDYQPCCCTPLYDAVGFTLTSMRNHVSALDDAVVVVTIITDGLENASREYTAVAVKELIEKLRQQGWTFTFMGANQDSIETAAKMSIRNARNFEYSDSGIRKGWLKETKTRMSFFSKLDGFSRSMCAEEGSMSNPDVRKLRFTEMADEAFDEEDSEA